MSVIPTEARATPRSSSQSKKRSTVWQQPQIVASAHPRSLRIHAANTATFPAWTCCVAGGSSSSSRKRSHRTAWPKNLRRASGRAARLHRRPPGSDHCPAAASIRLTLTRSPSCKSRRWSLLQNSGAQERSRRRQVRTNRLVAFRRRIHRQDICGSSNRPESRAEAASLAVRGQICPVSPCRESADPAIGSWNEVGFSSAGVSTGPPSAPGCRTSGGTSPWRDRGRVSDGRRIRPSDGR